MIHFIDIETGNIFDGHQPYCFWFDEGQSVGLNYVKQICFLSDKKEVVVKPSGIFKLLNLNPNSKAGLMAQETTIINDFEYKNLEDLVVITPEYSSFGYVQRGLCVHMIYVLASSQDAGQFQEPLVIDGEEFLVGADFYNENELLKSNLENIGFEVPDTIQKAIYEQDIKEESRNNILLNRKYKELLLEYKNILMNKGSYNSLINSLNWFEYGDLVKLQEYWKVPEKDVYLRSDLTNFLTESMRDMLNYNIKTTYIGLYLALNKIKYDENGHLIYEDIPSTKVTVDGVDIFSAKLNRGLQRENRKANRMFQVGSGNVFVQDDKLSTDDKDLIKVTGSGSNWLRLDNLNILPEPIPQLEQVVAIYNKEELALKMALLGNFFATYFMPIHLDLIHSTIENIVFTNTIKMIDFNLFSRVDYIDSTQSFYSNIDNSKLYYLDNVSVGVDYYMDFVNRDLEGKTKYSDVEILGVEHLNKVKYVSPDGKTDKFLPTFYSQLYSGVGCVVPVEFKIPVPVGEENIIIQKINVTKEYEEDGEIMSDVNGKKSMNVIIEPMGGYFDFKFNLLFTKAQTYTVGIELILNNGFTYSKRFSGIRILDNTNQDINIYKLKKLNRAEIDYILSNGDPNWNLFSFTTLKESDQYYRQYITTSNTPLKTGAGHTRVYRQKLYEFADFEEFKNYFGEHEKFKNYLGELEETATDTDYFSKIREGLLLNFDNSGDFYYDITVRYDAKSKDGFILYDEEARKNYKVVIHLLVISKKFVVEDHEITLKDYTQTPYVIEKDGFNWKNNFSIIQNNTGVILKDYMSGPYDIQVLIYKNEKLVHDLLNIHEIKIYEETQYYNSTLSIGDEFPADYVRPIYNIPVDKGDKIKFVFINLNNNIKFEIVITPHELLEEQSNSEFIFYPYTDKGLTISSNQEYFIIKKGEGVDGKPLKKKPIKGYSVISKDLFLPQFHKLVELEDYRITQDDVLCVIPQLTFTSSELQKPAWTFTNDSTTEVIEIKSSDPRLMNSTSILGPYISKFEQKQLDPGYYSIKFRYKLQDTEMVVEKNSCFLLK